MCSSKEAAATRGESRRFDAAGAWSINNGNARLPLIFLVDSRSEKPFIISFLDDDSSKELSWRRVFVPNRGLCSNTKAWMVLSMDCPMPIMVFGNLFQCVSLYRFVSLGDDDLPKPVAECRSFVGGKKILIV